MDERINRLGKTERYGPSPGAEAKAHANGGPPEDGPPDASSPDDYGGFEHAPHDGDEKTSAKTKPGADSALKYPSRFGLLTWPEITFSPKNNDLIKGVVELGGSALGFGESGCRKTFMASDMGMRVALGWDWFGRKVLQRGAIYIAAEGGLSMRRRVAAFRLHHNIPKDQDVPFALIPSPVDLLDAKADLPELLALIAKVAADLPVSLGLVVIDTLSRVLSGGNENAPDDMGALVRNIDRIRYATGAACLGVHHSGKDASKGGRGHSLLRAAMDTEIEVIKTEGQSTATITKQRDGHDGDTFTFGLQSVLLGHDEDGDPLTSCVVMPIEGTAKVKPKGKPPKRRSIPADVMRALDFLQDTIVDHGEHLSRPGYPTVKATTLTHWRERVRLRGLFDGDDKGRQRFRRAKESLVAEKLITIDGEIVWIVPKA